MNTEWWGYNKVHGWVVLDRSFPSNAPGLKVDLHFVRASDSATYVEKRENWNPPLYRFAPNYLKDMQAEDATKAAAELAAFKSIWPDIQGRIELEGKEIAERNKAQRIEEQKKLKAEARTKKKQDAEDKA